MVVAAKRLRRARAAVVEGGGEGSGENGRAAAGAVAKARARPGMVAYIRQRRSKVIIERTTAVTLYL